MNECTATEIRLELARGHWRLGEHEDAIRCLERCSEELPAAAGLAELTRGFLAQMIDEGPAPLVERLRSLSAQLDLGVEEPDPLVAGPALQTPTLAAVLADQGHTGQARQIADDVLRRRPEDARALALVTSLTASEDAADPRGRVIQELERWLGNLRRVGRPLENV